LAIERNSEGHFFLLTSLCDGQYSTSFGVFGSTGSNDADGWDISNSSANSLDRVEIFSSPDGWDVGQAKVQHLEAGKTYAAFANFNLGHPGGAEVTFSLDDVDGLEEGEVLVKDGAGAKEMPRDTFLGRLESGCE
jgi:hypothetical protein